jgi:hypothetical protein
MSRFNWRSFSSLVLSFSFVFVFGTGLVLWLSHSPQFLGIQKGIWKHTHIWMSLLMSVAAILHFILNWSVYWTYLWQKATGRPNLKWEFGLAFLVTAAILGTAAVPHSDNMMQRFAAMSLTQVAQMAKQPVEDLVAVLKKEGIAVHDPADSLREIAEHNKMPPQQVCEVVQRQLHGPGPHGER